MAYVRLSISLHATLLMMRQKSPKEFWNLINRERRECSTNSYLEPDKLYFHFKSLHECGAPTTVFSEQRVLTCVSELDDDILCQEVCLAMRNMKCHKSPGPPDLLSGERITIFYQK